MPSTALRRFRIEAARLRSLYLTTQFSYNQSVRDLVRQIRAREIDPTAPFRFAEAGDETSHVNAFAVVHRFKAQYPRYLRETVLVRLISSFEVLLLDVVREVFIARRDLFHSDNKRLEFSYGELLSISSVTDLWSKVINRDLRNLQNQGFKEIAKFYRTRLGIDMTKSEVPMEKLEEFHDRRHLLVHRLGKTDDEYRHRYSTDVRVVTVTEEYLLKCISDLEGVANWIYELATQKMAELAPGSERARPEYVMNIVLDIASDDEPTILKSDFTYHVGDRIHRLGDLLLSRTIESHTHTITIGGEMAAVRAYIKLLETSEGKGCLTIRQRAILRKEAEAEMRRKWKHSEALLRDIWNALPSRPWAKSVHKKIASTFNISNSQAAIAVGLFIQDSSKSIDHSRDPDSTLKAESL